MENIGVAHTCREIRSDTIARLHNAQRTSAPTPLLRGFPPFEVSAVSVMSGHELKFETLQVHAGKVPDPTTNSRALPI